MTPVVVATHTGPCAACGLPVLEGERIAYTLGTGPRHLACEDRPAELRRNEYAAPCAFCGVQVAKGCGRLDVVESREGEAFTRAWVVSCVDVQACHERIEARLGR